MMTFEEEILQLRDKIYDTAPDSIKNVLSDKSLVAIAVAEAYFKAAQDVTESKTQNKVLYFYNISDSDLHWRSACVITLFKMGSSVESISSTLKIDYEEVQELLRCSYPIGETGLSLAHLNRVALGESENEEISELIHSMGWTTEVPTKKIISTSDAQRLLSSGCGLGDIAAKFGLSVLDAMYALDGFVNKPISMQDVVCIQDWMCGKSIHFIGEKLRICDDTIKDILNRYGYAVGTDHTNIHYINDVISGKYPFNSDIKLAHGQKSLPAKRYVALHPVIEHADSAILKRYRNASMQMLADMVGCGIAEFKKIMRIPVPECEFEGVYVHPVEVIL